MTFSIERKSKVLSCQNSIFKSVWCVTPHLLMVNQKWSEAFSRVDATNVRWCHHHRVASTKPLYARRGTISAKKLRGVVLLFQSSFPAIQQKYPRHEYFIRSEATAESENLHFKMVYNSSNISRHFLFFYEEGAVIAYGIKVWHCNL